MKLKCSWNITRYPKYEDMCSVEYDWGESVKTQYFDTYKEALNFVGRYKKRIKEENLYREIKPKKYWIQMIPKHQDYKVLTGEIKQEEAVMYAIEIESFNEFSAKDEVRKIYLNMEVI